MLLLFLRLVHIVSGVFWVGSIMMAVFFVEPTAKAFGHAGDRFLAHALFRQRLMPVLVTAALLTVLAGGTMYWIDSAGLRLDWITTHTGLGFTAGAVAALAALVIALVVLKPQFDRLSSLVDATNEQQAEVDLDEGRLRRWSLIQVSLLIFAAAAMATARYLP
jgi:uncharacterized membrane protein